MLQHKSYVTSAGVSISTISHSSGFRKENDICLKFYSFILQVIERKRRAEQARLQYERELEEQKSGSLYFKKWCEAKRFPFYGMRNEQSVLLFFMDAYCCVWCGVDEVRLLVWGDESSSVGEGQEGMSPLMHYHGNSWTLFHHA